MYSFDIFDTLITRSTATPEGIFAFIQKDLIDKDKYKTISKAVRNNFYQLRIMAEKLARYTYQNRQTEDITLQQIYEAMNLRGEMTESQIACLMELECEIEYRESIPIACNISRIKQLLAEGETVILISDMYLPEMQIKSMLKKADPILETLPLFLSGSYKKGKYTGSLYLQVREELKINNWTHFGDHVKVDVETPRKLGISSEQFYFPELLSIEKKVLEGNEDNLWLQKMIGSSRRARLHLGMQKSQNDAWQTGVCAGGIVLFSYVNWILRNCKEKNISRLYFIARDGYVLKKIADLIIHAAGERIETYYIYGSRRAWRIASFGERVNDVMQLIRWSHGNSIKSIRDIADVFQIPVEELERFLSIQIEDDEQTVSYYTKQKIWQELQTNTEFKYFLKEYHAAKRSLVGQYLRQEIDFSDDDFAFVDVSGSGYTQGCLADIIRDFYDKPIRTFFFKLEKVKDVDNCINYCFCPMRLQNGVALEMLCRAPEAQTWGYEKENGKVMPVFLENQEERRAIIQHGFQDYLEGIEAFVKSVCQCGEIFFLEDMKQLANILIYITETPDDVLMRFIGDMPNSVTGREKKVITFAPVLTEEQIKAIYMEGRKDVYPNTALEFSLLRCDKKELEKIDFYKNLPKPTKIAYEFPYELCSGRIVLYGAGKLGQEIYRELRVMRSVSIVQWVDQNAKQCCLEGCRVEVPEVIGAKEYDLILIAVWKNQDAEDIVSKLLKRGIPAEKIVWFDPCKQWKRYFY